MDTNKLNLDAYYYSFEPTGVDAVDTILSAVADAGAGYHHTEDWHEQANDGSSPLSDMQAAAEKSAEAFRALKDENEVARMRIKELDLLFGRYILAMRAAVIDEECGGHGMKWIYNSLRGPGELPPEDEQSAQAYFDREIVAVDNGMQEVLAFHDQRRAMSKDAMKKTGD